jgi:hypothetical protein
MHPCKVFTFKNCLSGGSEVLTVVLLEMEIWDVTAAHPRRLESSKIIRSITWIKVCAVVGIKRQIP